MSQAVEQVQQVESKWKKYLGRTVLAAAVLLLSIYVVKVTTSNQRSNWFAVNYVLVAYVFVITAMILSMLDEPLGGYLDKLKKAGWLENYRYGTGMGSSRNNEYYRYGKKNPSSSSGAEYYRYKKGYLA